MISACIFDLDGTLVDTLAEIAGFMNGLLRSHGWPEHPVQAYRYMVGRGFPKLLEAAIPTDPAIDFQALYAEAIGLYSEGDGGRSQPYPGTQACLDWLAERQIATAIVTNKPQDIARQVVGCLFPGHPFRLVLGASDEYPPKPDPAGAMAAAAATGQAREACAFIGDSDVDMATARAAGMLAIGAAWGFRDAAELYAAGAHQVLDSISQLPGLLESFA